MITTDISNSSLTLLTMLSEKSLKGNSMLVFDSVLPDPMCLSALGFVKVFISEFISGTCSFNSLRDLASSGLLFLSLVCATAIICCPFLGAKAPLGIPSVRK